MYKTTPLNFGRSPRGWLRVRNSVTADPQYEGLAWRLVLSFEYIVTMGKFSLCSAQLQVFLNFRMAGIWPWFLLMELATDDYHGVVGVGCFRCGGV